MTNWQKPKLSPTNPSHYGSSFCSNVSYCHLRIICSVKKKILRPIQFGLGCNTCWSIRSGIMMVYPSSFRMLSHCRNTLHKTPHPRKPDTNERMTTSLETRSPIPLTNDFVRGIINPKQYVTRQRDATENTALRYSWTVCIHLETKN